MNTLRDPHLPSFLSWPRTRLGVISTWLGFVGLTLVIANVLTPSDGSQAGLIQLESMLMILIAPAALVTAVIAGIRDHERSIFVWIPIVLGATFLAFMLIELTFPHE